MADPSDQFLRQVEEYEAGVADLIAAYELAERRYFTAVHASTPYVAPMMQRMSGTAQLGTSLRFRLRSSFTSSGRRFLSVATT